MKKDLTNRMIGRLQVLFEAGKNKHGQTLWKCLCCCGNTTVVPVYRLSSGHTSSCGCKSKRIFLEGMEEDINYKKLPGESGLLAISHNYKKHAAAINVAYDLTVEELKELTKGGLLFVRSKTFYGVKNKGKKINLYL